MLASLEAWWISEILSGKAQVGAQYTWSQLYFLYYQAEQMNADSLPIKHQSTLSMCTASVSSAEFLSSHSPLYQRIIPEINCFIWISNRPFLLGFSVGTYMFTWVSTTKSIKRYFTMAHLQFLHQPAHKVCWQLMSLVVPGPSKVTRGEQSSSLTPTRKLKVIVILRKHQLRLLNNKNDITAIPGGVSVVLVVSNLTLTWRCHITTTKLQVAFLICQHLNVFYYH